MSVKRCVKHVWLMPVAAVLLGAVLLMSGCKRPQGQVIDPPPVNVKVQTVVPVEQVADTFVLPGVLEPARVVDISAEVAGRIEELAAREGQAVSPGQLLVRLNTEILQAELDRAQAQAEFSRREFERMQELFHRGAATQNELDIIRTATTANQAALALAQANLDRARIVAPVAGVLDELAVEKGEYVKAGDLVARIVDLDHVKVHVDVPERDVAFLSLGGQAEATVNGDRLVTGQITYISELADRDTRTSRIEITVDNRDRGLRTGQIARVRLTRRVLRDVIMIPLETVIPLEQGREVYVVQDGKAYPRPVELGLLKGASVQVVSGLEAGDDLIVSGQRFVGPGQPVRVVEQAASNP